MMWKQLFFVLLLLVNKEAYAQLKHDYNWAFGYGSSIPNDTNFFGGYLLSFKNSFIHFIPQPRDFEFQYQSNSFSNEDGNLLFMSNGCFIADKNAVSIKGGDSLSFGLNRSQCPNASPVLQEGLFVNFEKDDSLIYFIHSQWDTLGIKVHRKRLLITKINKYENRVINFNLELVKDTLVWNGLTGIKSIDHKYWWIVNPKLYSKKYITLKLDSNGRVVQRIDNELGFLIDSMQDGASQTAFSPDGKRFGIYFPRKGLQVFDFDRSSGIMTNARIFNINTAANVFGGIAFSPNSRFVYANYHTHLFQIDLEEIDSSLAIDTIGIFDNFFDPYPTTFLQMILGPDCRIYLSTYGSNRYIHVIQYPDRKGKECGFLQRGLQLMARNFNALPNNPHYRVDEPWPCDSTITIPLNTSVSDPKEGVFRKGDLLIYPQPAYDYILLQAIGMDDNPDKIEVFNAQGALIISRRIEFLSQELRIDVSSLTAGMYFIKLSNRNRIWTGRVMIGY